jgi:hypothetical protein
LEKIKVILVLSLVAIIAFSGGVTYVKVVDSPSGLFLGAVNYTVFTENNTYCAKASSGAITSNANFATLIQSLIDPSIVIYLSDNQVFNQTAPITVDVDKFTIKSESAIITYNGSSSSMFILGSTTRISNFQLQGI